MITEFEDWEREVRNNEESRLRGSRCILPSFCSLCGRCCSHLQRRFVLINVVCWFWAGAGYAGRCWANKGCDCEVRVWVLILVYPLNSQVPTQLRGKIQWVDPEKLTRPNPNPNSIEIFGMALGNSDWGTFGSTCVTWNFIWIGFGFPKFRSGQADSGRLNNPMFFPLIF